MRSIHVLFAIVVSLNAWAGGIIPGRFIVELSTPPTASRFAARVHRDRLRAEQVSLQRLLEDQGVQVLDSVDTVANALIVQAPPDAAPLLASIPGVRRVYPVHTVKMLLDRAVAFHQVTAAWAEIGQENAGRGVKIAIIDSGIDVNHPAFQDSSLSPPDSFPKLNYSADAFNTNNKIIVARSYVALLPYRDPDYSSRDHIGHGTALAMTAAGAPISAPLATIAGVAPKAFLGNYKIFGTPGYNDNSSDDVIIKAIDDAVADGMDIINLSLGYDIAPRLEDDLTVQAVERASKAGVLVIAAAGNNGPDPNTLSSPATAPSAIAVGAVTNDRTFAASAEAAGLAPFIAIPGDGNSPVSPVSAPVADVAALDGSGLACSPLPAGALSGQVALMMRGSCTFQLKLTYAQRAGAVAALVFAAADSPAPFTMATGGAPLPAEMISFADGMALKQAIAAQSPLSATLRFTLGPVPITPGRLTDFSAKGPNVDLGIKPDLLAAGADIYTATQSLDFRGDMYSSTGFTLVDGTSFSSPLVAGVAALLKAARPGLTVDQCRSLLINSATPAGLLDALSALHSTVVAYPTSLSLGAGGPDLQASRTLTLTNLGAAAETFSIQAPVFDSSTVDLAPGASVDLPLAWTASGLAPGPLQGAITIRGATSGSVARVPYWYAVTAPPAHITVLDSLASARRRTSQPDAIYFRVTDVSGVNVSGIAPEAVAISGGGAVTAVTNYDTDVPGLFSLSVAMGSTPGDNVFRITAGAVTLDVTISAL